MLEQRLNTKDTRNRMAKMPSKHLLLDVIGYMYYLLLKLHPNSAPPDQDAVFEERPPIILIPYHQHVLTNRVPPV